MSSEIDLFNALMPLAKAVMPELGPLFDIAAAISPVASEKKVSRREGHQSDWKLGAFVEERLPNGKMARVKFYVEEVDD